MAGRLDGKAVIITGAASGQGRVAAQLFAGEGASLVLTDADGEGLAESIATLSGAGSEPVAVIGDLDAGGRERTPGEGRARCPRAYRCAV